MKGDNLTITVVDSSNDEALNIARQTYPDSVPANSVASMVDVIINRVSLTRRTGSDAPVAIELLRIVGHGAPGRQGIGDSHTTNPNPLQLISLDNHGHLRNSHALMRLRGYFAAGASVELHGCRVGGQGFESLRQSLEALWGVPVRAGAIVQDPSTPYLDYLPPCTIRF